MSLKQYFFLKFFITIFVFYLSAHFFFNGYTSLEFNTINKVSIVKNIDNLSNNINVEKKKEILSSINDDLYETVDNDTIIENKIVIKVKKNDTFSRIMDPYFQNKNIKNKVINELNKEYNLKNLKIDQEIHLYQNSENIIEKILIPVNFSTDIILIISKNKVSLSKQKIKITKELRSNKFIVRSSLYKDGRIADIPPIVLSEAIKLYSFDVDFQRDIQKKDEFEISYEVFYSKKRESVSYGNIKYIKLSLKQNTLEYFMFKTDEGNIDYFDRQGKNVRKVLMKTPIDGARLSSSYGVRKHPILGYNQLHKGVDFAAPKGTPIYAAGNGVIDFIGGNGGYGKYIRIRHNSSYKTAYAHLNSFKKDMYRGLRVNQGDIIGYVGSTGKSTGSHLHYEIIYQDTQINPMKLKLPSGKKLVGKELKKFQNEMKIIYSDFLFDLYE